MSQSEVLEIALNEYSSCKFASSIDENIELAEIKILKLNETIDSIRDLKPECDKIDYALAACSGALCGVIDIFLVGKPGESPIGNLTDKWFENRMLDFSKLCGWGGDGDKASALRHLEKKFKIPYDQTGMGDAAITNKLQECCCNMKTTVMEQGFQNQLALERQTNTLGRDIEVFQAQAQLQACQNTAAVTQSVTNLGYQLQQHKISKNFLRYLFHLN